ncbi:FapA family protein [Sporosarcina sp. 179-K 3D1 HS]|uniref:flagellar assembly protein A n=1 Tax=Sporosarcina sp. 179-K 3D1 HS TaxID=3232169 RepID=UPI0039A0958C
MGKSIIVKAETIDEAVQLALSILELQMEDVHIEVLSNPGRTLFGLRKTLAEVNVSQIVEHPSAPNAYMNIEDNLDRVLLSEEGPRHIGIPVATEKAESASRIKQKQIETIFTGGTYPILWPASNVRLYVNEKRVTDRVIITPGDEVKVKVNDEWIPPRFSIQLIEHDMLALLLLTPGKKIKRTLADTGYEAVLRIEAEEEVEPYNDLDPQKIVDRLKDMGVKQGLIFSAIKKATEELEPFEAIIAKGEPPVPGLDGDLEVHIRYEEKVPEDMERVDFRETNPILNVEAGQVIATKIAAVPGKEGKSLFGEVIPVKPVKDVIIRTGKNAMQIDLDIVAVISGRPTMDRRGKFVNIDVNHELHHRGEINLESGNIRFEGDVRIDGNVHPSMYVRASGNLHVGGTVTKATVHAMKSTFIKGNVFSSTVVVGQQELIIGELVAQLKEILLYMEQIRSAIGQVLLVRGEIDKEVPEAELNLLIRLLLEKKYTSFQEVNRTFIQNVKNHTQDLTPEWSEFAQKCYGTFISSLNQEVQDMAGFEQLILEARTLVELYGETPEPASVLTIPYAINSVLHCNGDIEVISKGLYHCSVTAGGNVIVQGLCRGGEINARGKVSLLETGSKNNVKTLIKTGPAGSITIGTAYAGTEIQIGVKRHRFMHPKLGVFARLDEAGELVVD